MCISLTALRLVIAVAGATAPATIQAAPRLTEGAVAASDAFGAAAASEILKRGGNAVDAAVAAGFAEAVTYPEAGNIGGGGTLNGSYGAGVVVEGAGFLLNDEMDDFSAKPGTPNQFGVVGSAANAIAPHKRPLSSMTPTILVKDGTPALVIGTPSGSRIFTSVFQVIVDIYDNGLSLTEAVAAPRFHHKLTPENTIFTEPYAPAGDTLTKPLTALGYRFVDQGFNGDIEAIRIVGGRPEPASDPRQRGVSLVVHYVPRLSR